MNVFLYLLLFRLASVALVQTWFVPDEVFQSVEVAHQAVFGTGHLSWEWERRHALRSIIHPSIFIVPFWILKRLGLDAAWLVNILPNVIHAFLFAVADSSMVKLAKTVHGVGRNEEVKATMVVYLSNWFTIYCAPRTLSNSLETVLTVVALKWFPFTTKQARVGASFPFEPYVILAALSIVVRPTSVAIWASLGLWHLYHSERKLRLLLRVVLPAAAAPVLIAFVLDSLYYGRPTISAWNFIHFNVLQGGSAHFGVHPWHWYFTNGLPAVFTLSMLPLIVHAGRLVVNGLSSGKKELPDQKLLWVSAFYIFVHSSIAHKEHRFLLPIMPLLSPYVAFEICRFRRLRKMFIIVVVCVNLALAAYFGLIHQRGPVAATAEIRLEVKELTSKHPDDAIEILHLMPCYSLPQYAAFHGLAVNIRALDCAPDLASNRSESYVDEADAFHANPGEWLVLNWRHLNRAQIIVAYEKVYRGVEKFLSAQGFLVRHSIFHSHALTSSRQDHYIVIAVKH